MNAVDLKKIRNKYGWTQKETAQKLKVTLRTVQNWEDGSRKMPDSTQKLLDMILHYEMRVAQPKTAEPKEGYAIKITAEDIIANKVLAKLQPYFDNIEAAMAEGLMSLEDIKDTINAVK